MLFSVMLWMPSWGGMINGLLTLRGAWHKVAADPVLKFFVVGVTFYGMSTFEGPMLSVKSVNALSHYTDWTIAHVHAGALGWNGFMTFGMMYWLRRASSRRSSTARSWPSVHFWIGTIGILLYVVPIWAAGITQGLMWRAFDETGRLQYPDFVETVIKLMPMYWVRVVGGTCTSSAWSSSALQHVMTWRKRPAKYAVPGRGAAAGHATPPDARVRSRPSGTRQGFGRFLPAPLVAPPRGSACRVLHRAGRGRGGGGLAVRDHPDVPHQVERPDDRSVKPYTPLELAGRDIYIAEGCYNCHSQMVRPFATRPSATASTASPASSSTTTRSSGAAAASGRTWPARAASTPTSGTCSTSRTRAHHARSIMPSVPAPAEPSSTSRRSSRGWTRWRCWACRTATLDGYARSSPCCSSCWPSSRSWCGPSGPGRRRRTADADRTRAAASPTTPQPSPAQRAGSDHGRPRRTTA
jgi:hypothetical protein